MQEDNFPWVLSQRKGFLEKPRRHIGTIGHAGHGKTTLTAALHKFWQSLRGSPFRSYEQLKAAADPTADGIPTVWIEHKTDDYHCIHTDYPADAEHLPRLIAGLSQLDIAILVVSAVEGLMPQTREHLRLARHLGVPVLVVFLNKMDLADPARADQVERELRQLLSAYGFPGDQIPVIRGSAHAALADTRPEIGEDALRELQYRMEQARLWEFPTLRPFLMPVEEWFHAAGRGPVAMGRVNCGTLKVYETVEVVGLDSLNLHRSEIRLSDLRLLGESGDEVEAGDRASVTVRGRRIEDLRRGQVLAKPASLNAHNEFTASIYVLTEEDGGRGTVVIPRTTPLQFHLHTAEVTGEIRAFEVGKYEAEPGETVSMTVQLSEPVALWRDLRVAITEDGRTVGAGIITAVGYAKW